VGAAVVCCGKWTTALKYSNDDSSNHKHNTSTCTSSTFTGNFSERQPELNSATLGSMCKAYTAKCRLQKVGTNRDNLNTLEAILKKKTLTSAGL